MARVTIKTEFSAFATAVRRGVRVRRETLTRAVSTAGLQVLSFVWQDYRKKSNGGIDAAGVQWARPKDETIAARVRRRAPWRRLWATWLAIREEEQIWLKKKPKRGSAAARSKKRALERIRRKRQTNRAQRQRLIEAELATAKIGVDRGLLIASLNPNASSPDNVFEVKNLSVTIGSSMVYAKPFDVLRPIIPDGIINAQRQAAIETLVANVYENELRKELE